MVKDYELVGCQTVLLWRSDDAPPSWGQTFVVRSLDELLALPNLTPEI